MILELSYLSLMPRIKRSGDDFWACAWMKMEGKEGMTVMIADAPFCRAVGGD